MSVDALPWLLGDVGGTNARFALQDPQGLHEVRVLSCAGHAGLVDALRHYLGETGAQVRHAAIGIATPVHGDRVRMTNHHWSFSTEELRRELGLHSLLVLNDFAALALALPTLQPIELQQLGGTEPAPGAARVVLGPGTGLGVAALLPLAASADHGERGARTDGTDAAWHVLAGEGGHVGFGPGDDDELELWRYARARHGRVSAERILSGPGLELVHAWLRERAGADGPVLDAARITDAALRARGEADALCRQALEMFCGMLGSFAADVALTLDARGGVYLGGGILPRLGEFVEASPMRSRFEAKGRFAPLLARVPMYVIHSPWPALHGAAAALRQHLARAPARAAAYAPAYAPAWDPARG